MSRAARRADPFAVRGPLWHPHTEAPAEPGTVAVIAILLGDDPAPEPALADGLYHWIGERWVSEGTRPHRTVLDDAVFWWCRETDLLDALIAEHDVDTAAEAAP